MRGQAFALRIAGRVPERAWKPLVTGMATVVAARPPRQVRQWQLNLETATGVRPDNALTRAGLESWGRNLFESMQLGSWSRDKVMDLSLIHI